MFQDVVAIIHAHMAEGATVEESAMLMSRVTGKAREVDVVLTTDVAGHTVIVSVEASSGKRPATVEWVERMIGKHADLPTDKLVPVSESGFRPTAREYGDAKGVVAIATEDLAAGDPAFRIVNRLSSIWPKTVSFTPEAARIAVVRPDGTKVWFRAMPDHLIVLDDDQEVGTVLDVFHGLRFANARPMFEQIGLADISEDTTAPFLLSVGPNWTVSVADSHRSLFVRFHDVDPPELHQIEQLLVEGTAQIEVGEIPLTHGRLGEVMYAYGEGAVGDQKALVLFTENEEGGKATIRFRRESGIQ